MTDGVDPRDPVIPSDEDRRLAADHDDEGVDVALAIARASRGEPAGTPRRDDAGEVLLPPPRRSTVRRRRRSPNPPTWSGPGKDARDPMALGNAFTNLVKSKGWGRQVNLHLVLSRWPELVGPTNAEHSRPVKYQGTVLTRPYRGDGVGDLLAHHRATAGCRTQSSAGRGDRHQGHHRGPHCSQLETRFQVSAGSWTARHLWLRSLTLEGVGTERRTRENIAHMG